MSSPFFKFPSTKHLAVLKGTEIRGDKVMSALEREDLLQHHLVVEEKIDGANLGISFDDQGNVKAQNRGSYIPLNGQGLGQWKKLEEWITPRLDSLFEILEDKYILFGEWCYARHSVSYDKLPDWFIGFDIFNRNECRFLSTNHRNLLMEIMDISLVPVIEAGVFSFPDLKSLMGISKFGRENVEGLYIRFDSENWTEKRAKLVRPAFMQSQVSHWTKKRIIPNTLTS